MHGEERSPLELTPERMRELGYRVIDLLVDRYVELPQRRPWRGTTRAALDRVLRESAPEAPRPFDDVLARLVRDVLPYNAAIDHPRFLAFVPGSPTWPGVLGDLIAAGSNIFQGTWLASAGASALELVVIDWFRQWLGCDDGTAGILVSGGSAANLTALACARLQRGESAPCDGIIYASAETHSSVLRAARVLGFARDRIRTIAVDEGDRLDVAALEAAITDDRRAGLTPFLVVANAGTTSTGAIDPLEQLADLCARASLWLHVDAAYGGFACLTDEGRLALRGIERADSIVLDPHKWLYQPFEVGCLLVRDGAALERAFHVMPPYLQDTALPDSTTGAAAGAGPLPINFANRGIQLTRGARVLKLWLSIQTLGLAAFRETIQHTLELARYAEQRIRTSEGLELLTPARLGIVCFRRRAARDDAHDELNRMLQHALLESGLAMMSSTRVRGRFALRLCILNYRTRRADIDRVLDWIEAFTPPDP